jgi:hypothetical protein
MALINAKWKHRPLAGVVAAGVLAATVGAAALPATANAEWRGDDRHEHWHHGPWAGGYYRAPPVVYSNPYYYAPPPVVVGPGFGINLNIR